MRVEANQAFPHPQYVRCVPLYIRSCPLKLSYGWCHITDAFGRIARIPDGRAISRSYPTEATSPRQSGATGTRCVSLPHLLMISTLASWALAVRGPMQRGVLAIIPRFAEAVSLWLSQPGTIEPMSGGRDGA